MGRRTQKDSKNLLFKRMAYLNPDFNEKLDEAYVDKDGNLIDEPNIPNQNTSDLVDFESFPDSVKKTLENEYGDFQFNFDWNEKQDEFRGNHEGFREWLKKIVVKNL